MQHYTPLNRLDTYFLRADATNAPAHIASVSFLDAAPLVDADERVDLERLIAHFDGRLDRVPVLRQRVVEPPLRLHPPVWVDDDRFDLRRHVLRADLRPGASEEELLALFLRLQAEHLPRDRPLWRVVLTEPLASGSIAMISIVHHALMDANTGSNIAMLTFDLTAEVPPPVSSAWIPAPAPSPVALAARGCAALARQPRRVGRKLGRLARAAVRPASGPVAPALDDETPSQALRIAGPVGPTRLLERRMIPLADLQAARSHGATVTAVVLAATGQALRDLALKRGLDPEQSTLEVRLPRAEQPGDVTFGNHLSGLRIPLRLGIADPVERLAEVAALMDLAKAGSLWLPPGEPDLVLSSVRSLDVPLYVLGARVSSGFTLMPLFGMSRLALVASSSDGVMRLNFTADGAAVPELAGVADATLATLQALASIGQPARGVARLSA